MTILADNETMCAQLAELLLRVTDESLDQIVGLDTSQKGREYCQKVRSALAEIEQGDYEKVIIARALEMLRQHASRSYIYSQLSLSLSLPLC